MKMIRFAALAVTLLTALTGSALAFENSRVVGQVPDRLVITVREGVDMNLDKAGGVKVGVPGLDALADRYAVQGMEQMYAGMTGNLKSKSLRDHAARFWAVDFPADQDIDRVEAAYKALPEVELVQRVDICRMDAFLPNDLGGSQWYLRNLSLGGASIRAVGAWNQSLGDSNIVVGVLDSGVDWHHPDLGGTHPDKVTGAIWTNWTEYYGTAGIDDDGNGKVDDVRGWDFVTGVTGYPGEDVQIPDNDPMDYAESHGTSCSGCVAAITNNGVGIAGTAPGCKVMAVRVGWLPNGETTGVVRMDFASQGILYAANNGVNIISCSWGSTSFLSFAVTAATDAGVLMFTSAGNDDSGEADYLSTHPDVLSVAATNSSDAKASFSNYGTWVELSAPGVDIYTTFYNQSADEHTYASVSGTSFSCPIAAGSAALIWSANPGMTRTQIASLLRSSCDDIDAINPSYTGLLGDGRVNLLKALGDAQHRYPSEFPTLFDAFNEASAGDEIAIEGGITLAAPVTVPTRQLLVHGGYASDYASRDPIGNPTIISGTSAVSGLKFQGAVTNATVVDGFEIRNCGGQSYGGIPYNARYGGGVSLNQASPTLRNLLLTGNTVGGSSDLGCGGGLNANLSTAVLENVTITGNAAVYGAGLFAYQSDLTLIDCVIDANAPITTNLANTPKGGGIHLVDSDITLIDCQVSGHAETVQGGGIYAVGSGSVSNVTMSGGEISGNTAKDQGGGLYQSGGLLTMTNVAVTNNGPATGATFMSGGGLYTTGASTALDSLRVIENNAMVGGGAALTGGAQVDVQHSLFAFNSASFYGGGLDYESNAAGLISSNTICGNSAPGAGGGGLYLNTSSPDIQNNISAFNIGGAAFANGMALNAAPASLSCNDVFSNANAQYSGVADPTGTDGNISADPLFCDVVAYNYSIANNSPCAPAQTGACGLIGAFGTNCGGSPVPDENPGTVPAVFAVERNFPNPFNPKTTIRFSLAEAARTKVAIFDVSGRLVKTLLNEDLAAKSYEVTWEGRDEQDRSVAAGVYFYQVTSGAHQAVGRMALVK